MAVAARTRYRIARLFQVVAVAFAVITVCVASLAVVDSSLMPVVAVFTTATLIAGVMAGFAVGAIPTGGGS